MQDNFSETSSKYNSKNIRLNNFTCMRENKIRELYNNEKIESFIKDTINYKNMFYDD